MPVTAFYLRGNITTRWTGAAIASFSTCLVRRRWREVAPPGQLRRWACITMSPRIGDIFEIALPDGRFAYGKVFRDASVGIYATVFDSPTRPPVRSDFAFVVGLYGDVLGNGGWSIIGHEPFETADAEWPPPNSIQDPISGEYSRYHKGVITPASETECRGLEPAAVWHADHIIRRIIDNNGVSR